MEKPFIQIHNQPLAAPISEMVDVAISTLTSQSYEHFSYFENPDQVHAKCSEGEMWNTKQFTKKYSIEVTWKPDPAPPSNFYELTNYHEHLNPILLTIRMKVQNTPNQSKAEGKLKSVWQELKSRALDTANALQNKPAPTDHGTARFATFAELEKDGYLSEQSQENIGQRFIIGSFKGHAISVPRKLTEAHTIVAGPPGVGKSRSVFIPNLIERTDISAIVTEVTAGEDILPTVYSRTAGYRKSKGQTIYYLNPSDFSNSTRFNPVDLIHGVDDAIRYANLIITNTTFKFHSGDQIWTQAENHLLVALLLYAWGLGGRKRSVEGGKSNLGYIRYILRLGPQALQEAINKDGIPEARERFNEFLMNSSPNFRLGVFSGLIQRLNPWLSPIVVKLTEVSDFTPEDLQEKLFTFYLAYAINRPDYRPLMALAFNFLVNFPLNKTPKKPLTLLLDEFAAYGYIADIDNVQATIRNKGIGMVFGFQDQQQLSKIYSPTEAETIFGMTDTKLIFATGSGQVQYKISQMLGQTTKQKKQVSSTGLISRHTYGGPLLEPAEIGRIPDGKVLVIRNKRFPLLADTIPPGTYESYFIDYPPPQAPKKQVPDVLFDQCDQAKELQYSKADAARQTATYKQRHEQMEASTRAYQDAIKGNFPAHMLQDLKTKAEDAKKAYLEMLEETVVELLSIEDAKMVLKTKLQDAPVTSAESTTATEDSPAATQATVSATDATAVQAQETDPFSGLYSEEADDPNDPFYEWDEK